jgi:HEAT repeat protein
MRGAIRRIWERVPALPVLVDEHAFRCFGTEYGSGEGRDNLAFLFYKDGVRAMTFQPGFEDEAERFLAVINLARQADQKGLDDMVTLLWEQEFAAFQYSYVDLLAEGIQIPQSHGFAPGQIDPLQIEAELAAEAEEEEKPTAIWSGAPPVSSLVSPENFVETLYFLESDELAELRGQLDLEWHRDTKAAVLDALFDRIEDPLPARQSEILRIFRQLLPAFLSRGDLGSATKVLREIIAHLDRPQVEAEQREEAVALLRELGEPEVLGQLLRSLEDGSIDPSGEELGVFLSHLGRSALPLLIHATQTTQVDALRQRLDDAVTTLGRAHVGTVIELIESTEHTVAVGAVRVASRLELTAAAAPAAALLKRVDAAGRRQVVESLVRLKSSSALNAAQEALGDDDREVRIAAARGIGVARYQPARARLEDAINGRALREADLTEQIAFFEAYGAVAPPTGVELLDRLLNGRKLFGKESPELRACAAMALGRMNLPAAKSTLQKAADDAHPMVRSAVSRALGHEASVR